MRNLITDENYEFLREMVTKRRVIFIAIVTVLLFFMATYGYGTFHGVIEIFTVVIGYCIGLICLNAQKYFNNGFFSFLCIGYAFIGTLDIIHVIALPTSNIMPNIDNNKFIQLSLITKLLECVTILMAFNYTKKKINIKKTIVIYTVVTVFMVISILYFNFIPSLYVKGKGLTPLRIISSYAVFFMYVFSIIILKKKKQYFSPNTYKSLYIVLILLALSNVVYGTFIGSINIARITNHYFKLMAYGVLYFTIVKIALNDPYDLIFKELNDKALDLGELNKRLRYQNQDLVSARGEIVKSKEKYEKILNFLPDAIIIREKDSIEYVNDEFLRIFKYKSAEDIIGKSIYTIAKGAYRNVISKRLEESKYNDRLPLVEVKLMASDEELIMTEISALSLNIDNRRYNLVVIRDITERKRIEKLKNELEEKDNLRTEFFANLSHELRTPINVIHSALQLEDIYIENNDIGSIKKYNFIVKQNCYRILRMCNNLIDSNRVEAGFIKPNFSCCEIVSLVENVTSSVIRYISMKKMTLIFDTEIEESYLMCDLDFMERIILNLISNSIKFGKENGNIWVCIKKLQNNIYISIKDNGIGIAKNRQAVVFERFIQEDKSFTRKCEGSGIGLSLVKSFVELQGGNIVCISEEGVGTEFIITLPLTETLEEVASTSTCTYVDDRIMQKINVEFADIYFN